MERELLFAAAFFALLCLGPICTAMFMACLQWTTSRLCTGIAWCVHGFISLAVPLVWRLRRAVRSAINAAAKKVLGWGTQARHATAAWFRFRAWTVFSKARRAPRARTTPTPAEHIEPVFTDCASPAEGQTTDHEPDAAQYARALDLLNLTGVEPLTQPILKQRYGELIRAVDPGKGFPRTFSIQLNAAVQTIKKVHQWK